MTMEKFAVFSAGALLGTMYGSFMGTTVCFVYLFWM